MAIELLSGQYGESPGSGIVGVLVGLVVGLLAGVTIVFTADRLSGVSATVLVAYATFGVVFLAVAGLRYVNVPGADEAFTFPAQVVVSLLLAVVVAVLVGRGRELNGTASV